MKNTQVINQQKKACMKNLRYFLDQSTQSTDVKKQLHSTVNLDMTFHKTAGESNMHVGFGYVPQTICNQTWGKVSVLNDNELIISNKQVINQLR